MSTVYNKKYFTDLLEKLVLPLKEHYSEECANLYLGHTGAAFKGPYNSYGRLFKSFMGTCSFMGRWRKYRRFFGNITPKV